MPRRSTKSSANQAIRFQHPAIRQMPLDQIKWPSSSARTHSRAQRRKLEAIIRAVGFIDPIVVDENRRGLAGRLRAETAQDIGLHTVPVIQIDHLNEVEKRTYVLAANRIAEDAGWDRSILAVELGELAVLLPEAEIDLEATGFTISEVDQLILDGNGQSPDPAETELSAFGPPVSALGDLWLCRQSRLLCADALIAASFETLMNGHRATMTITDPPYNVSILKHARRSSKASQREFSMASGEMTDAEFLNFLNSVFRLIANANIDGAIIYSFIDWSHLSHMLTAGSQVFSELKNVCVWVKSNGGMGSFYRSRHEMICVFKNGTAPHINTFELGQHGRSRTNVWEYAGLNAFRSGRKDELDMHPTVKPVRMIADAMFDCSKPKSIVLDPFMGSGSTLIAAEIANRRAYGLEIDPAYVDVCVRRWQAFTGRDAILQATGQTFSEIQNERLRCGGTPPRARTTAQGAK